MSMEEENLHMDALRMSIQPPMTVKEEKDTSWQERFDDFIDTLPNRVGDTPKEALKSFIHQEREALLKEIIEEIDKMKKKSKDGHEYNNVNGLGQFNIALTEVQELIKKKI